MGTVLMAQFKMTSKSHGLLANEFNQMKLCNYAEPGQAGMNVTWDFSGLELKDDFQGSIDQAFFAQNASDFSNANVVLKEFSNQFFFEGNENQLLLKGVAVNGKPIMKFSEPFVKMKYPFTMGDQFSGTYGGKYFAGKTTGTIDGNYNVKADAYGKLILPGGVEVPNALRVKTVRNYTRKLNSSASQVQVTTYRWYAENVRFPMLVFIENKVTNGNREHVSHQAAYKDQYTALKKSTSVDEELFEAKLNVYPNPYKELLNIEYNLKETGEVKIELFNSVGQKLKTIVDETRSGGEYAHELKASELNLKPGAYYIKFNLNGKEKLQKVMKL
jgi:hypothetical protein